MIRTGYVGATLRHSSAIGLPVTFDGTSEQTSSIIVQALFGNWWEEVHV